MKKPFTKKDTLKKTFCAIKIKIAGLIITIGLNVVISSCKRTEYTSVNSVETMPIAKVADETTAHDSAWHIGFQNRKLDNFEHHLELAADSGRMIRISVIVGNFFGTGKYMILREEAPTRMRVNGSGHFIQGYRYEPWRDGFRAAFSFSEKLENYVNDTIRDMNNDGRIDFAAHYRTTINGITSRYTMVCLALSDSTFSRNGWTGLLFVNPQFSYKEKIVRGMLHGKSGDTEIYKFRWNDNYGVDTIEYIYSSYFYGRTSEGPFVKSHYIQYDHRNRQENFVVLKSLPDEYKSLPELDWFLGKK